MAPPAPARNRSGSVVGPRPFLQSQREPHSPDELDLILKEEPAPVASAYVRTKCRSTKIEQAKKKALRRSKGEEEADGEIPGDELLLK